MSRAIKPTDEDNVHVGKIGHDIPMCKIVLKI